MLIILCLKLFAVFPFFHFPLLRNHKSSLCNDQNNNKNVFPLLALPFILFKYSGTKVK
jgi:hypothetical protein